MANKFELYDIVDRINGGGIEPIGESHYDRRAFVRMKEIENLANMLIDDILRIYELEGHEASIVDARFEAERWLLDLKEILNDYLPPTDKVGDDNESGD